MFVPSLPTLVYKDDTKQIINVVIFTCNDSLPTSVLGYIYIHIYQSPQKKFPNSV